MSRSINLNRTKLLSNLSLHGTLTKAKQIYTKVCQIPVSIRYRRALPILDEIYIIFLNIYQFRITVFPDTKWVFDKFETCLFVDILRY